MSAPPPQSLAADPSPTRIGDRFEIEKVLGRGGMGTVYQVRDPYRGERLALKRVVYDAQPNLRALFEREYLTLARLTHPLVIRVHEFALAPGGAYYTMELLDGEDLSRLAPLPYPRVCRYVRQVATILALLHARRLVHRDISPRNVRVTTSDECKLLDFGALGGFGETGAVIGTPPCVPPEGLEREPLDQRVDLYGLGCLAYFALTGRHAYPASQVEQLPSYWAKPIEPPSKPAAALHSDLPAIPEELDQLVLKLLQLDRSARLTSAGAVIDRLNVILGQGALPAANDQLGADPILQAELELAESYFESAPTVGREPQLEAALHCAQQLQRGRGQVVVFEGAEGVGKTRLLHEIELAIQVRGTRVVSIDARVGDRPFDAARALCRGLYESAPASALGAASPNADVLGRLLPELSRKPLGNTHDAVDVEVWHDQLQSALRSFLVALSQQGPIALLIDNLHACDHESAALIGSLTRETRQHPLLLLATLRPDVNSAAAAACRTLRASAQLFTLEELNPAELENWLCSLFGRDTPNLPRLCQFVHAQTGGQPGQAVELLYTLLRAQAIGYRDGTWLLPLSPSDSAPAGRAASMLQARIGGLSSSALSVAQTLSLYGGSATLNAIHNLCEIPSDQVESGLSELLERRLLVRQRDGYAFAHDGIRHTLRRSIPDEARTRMQRHIGAAILQREAPTVAERLEAGLHLFEAGDEYGLRLLCHGSLALCLRPQASIASVPILERALELANARKRSLCERAGLLAALALCTYSVDRRLERYSQPMIDCFTRLTGLDTARALRPWLGKHLSMFVGLGGGLLRHALTRPRRRPIGFVDLVRLFLGATVALCGKSTICLDGPGVRRLSALLEPFTVFGSRHITQFIYDYTRALGLVTQDRYTEITLLCHSLEQRLETPSVRDRVSAETLRLWQSGMHYVLGLLESFACDPKALARAEQLEASQFNVDRLIAAQLRRVYHTFRGEIEPLRAADAAIEAYALQTGSTWQVETWSAIVTNYAAMLCGDPIDAKRAVEETQRLALDVPSLARYAASSRALYCLQLGQVRECIEIYREMLQQEGPRQRIGWSVSMGLLASAHNAVGEYEQARVLVETALRESASEDARYAGMRLPVVCARLNALAALGEHDEAARYESELLARYADTNSPLVLGTLHEAAARNAWLRKDRKDFTLHLKEVEKYFCPLGHAALIGRFLELTGLGGSEGDMDAKIALMREVKAFDSALSQLNDRETLARHVFAWLMQRCQGFQGYLFVKDTQGPQLLAASDDHEPPDSAVELAARGLSSLNADEVTTHCGPIELNTQAERPGAKRADRTPQTEILHLHLLSFVEQDKFHGEGALVLRGTSGKPPRLRYDLLQVAAQHFHRLRLGTAARPIHSGPPTTDHSATA